MWRAILASLLLCACGVSSSGSRAGSVRGFSRGWGTYNHFYPYVKAHDTTLTPGGAAVALLDEAPACTQVGYVTGIATTSGEDQSIASLLDEATNDARNRTAGHGDALVIDATETWWDQPKGVHTTRAFWGSAHGRVFHCPEP